MKHYTKTVQLAATGEKLFESISAIPLWWTAMFEGSATQAGGKFTVRFGPQVYKTFLVEEMLPYIRIVWDVVDAFIDIPELKNKKEWIGSKIIWEIIPLDTGCELRFTHIGLTPDVECYTICEKGWNNFLQSLVIYTTTGTGTPFKIN